MATVSIATTARDLADSTWIWLVAHDGSWWLPATTMDLEGGGGGSGGSLSSSNLSCYGKLYPSQSSCVGFGNFPPFPSSSTCCFCGSEKYVRPIVYGYM
jgi:hypothetical protein